MFDISKFLLDLEAFWLDLQALEEQGWHSGESSRFPRMWPGVDFRTRHHMWFEFVVGSRLCPKGLSRGLPVLPPLQKPTLLNSN